MTLEMIRKIKVAEKKTQSESDDRFEGFLASLLLLKYRCMLGKVGNEAGKGGKNQSKEGLVRRVRI